MLDKQYLLWLHGMNAILIWFKCSFCLNYPGVASWKDACWKHLKSFEEWLFFWSYFKLKWSSRCIGNNYTNKGRRFCLHRTDNEIGSKIAGTCPRGVECRPRSPLGGAPARRAWWRQPLEQAGPGPVLSFPGSALPFPALPVSVTWVLLLNSLLVPAPPHLLHLCL